MDTLERYLEVIVEPTFKDFGRNRGSYRNAYLACLVTYHAIDRATYPASFKTAIHQWRKESFEFNIIEEVALTLKHVKSDGTKWAKANRPPDTLLLCHCLGLEGNGEGLETRNLWFVIRDTIKFLKEKLAAAEEKNQTV